jgi:hypothetical protein
MLGSSLRTAQRWAAGRAHPSADQWKQLATRVFDHDEALAAQIAMHAGHTLETLGLVRPAAGSAGTTGARVLSAESAFLVIDGIVCGAAEALDMSPRALRAALFVAFDRARTAQLDVGAVAEALRPTQET